MAERVHGKPLRLIGVFFLSSFSDAVLGNYGTKLHRTSYMFKPELKIDV